MVGHRRERHRIRAILPYAIGLGASFVVCAVILFLDRRIMPAVQRYSSRDRRRLALGFAVFAVLYAAGVALLCVVDDVTPRGRIWGIVCAFSLCAAHAWASIGMALDWRIFRPKQPDYDEDDEGDLQP